MKTIIEVDGYKAFRGVLKVTPKTSAIAPFELEGDWLYKPEYDCWYGCGRSLPASVCEVVKVL